MRPAEIIKQKMDAAGVSYYVHYIDGMALKPYY